MSKKKVSQRSTKWQRDNVYSDTELNRGKKNKWHPKSEPSKHKRDFIDDK